MLRNYLTVALRNFTKSPLFSFINVAGLSLGIAVFILILQYIGYEKSVNKFHKNLPEINRILFESAQGEQFDYSAPSLGPRLKQEFAEVKSYCRVAEGIANGVVGISENENVKSFKAERAAYADESFFNLFSFPISSGNGAMLAKPNTVAISVSTAKKYFGNSNALEKTISINNEFGENLYTIVAVFYDFPLNSDLQYDLILSIQTLANPANLHGSDWANLEGTSSYLTTYLQLEENSNKELLSTKANELINKIQPDNEATLHLQPLEHLHLAPSLSDRQLHTGSLGFIYLIGGIAILILTIAWLNYINLSTAGALKRAKEIGLRKVVGASKKQLIAQFLGESLFLNLLSFTIAIGLVNVLQTLFNQLINKNLSLQILTENSTWAWGIIFLLVGTIVSGAYTAFALSSFNPAQTLKGTFSKSASGLALRKTLVVFQFTISILLIIATVIMDKQLSFMQNENLGMNMKQLLVIRGAKVGQDSTYQNRKQSFENALDQAGFIERHSSSASVPTDGYNYSTSGITQLNAQPGEEKYSYSIAYVDHQFFTTYEIPILAGSNFSYEDCNKNWRSIDKIILNEKAVNRLGFANAEDAVGKKIRWNDTQIEIAGVVIDYHHLSLKQEIEPILFIPQLSASFFTIKLQANNIQEHLKFLKQTYAEFFPGNPFEYFFVSDNYKRLYQAEEQHRTIFTVASCLAIFIACLGLLGLATFSVDQRTKEIGIRKVMGASIVQITSLLSKDFLILIIVAISIATPLAILGMTQWLEQFAYKTEITIGVFLLSGLIALSIALLTVASQTIKAALSNPVNCLRSE